MGLIGYRTENGKKKYCLYDSTIKTDVISGHPARFSAEDTFSKYRIEFKTARDLIPK